MQCKYSNPRDCWRCPEETATGGGVCILHDPNLTKDVALVKACFNVRLTDEMEDPLRFDGTILPEGISFSGIVFLSGAADFREITFGDKGELVFDWVDLSRTQFLHTDLSRVKFFDATWDHPYGVKLEPFRWFHWRCRVYDETRWREDRLDLQKRREADTKHLSHLGRLYRALKSYYHEIGQHHLVGHFHYGLMEEVVVMGERLSLVVRVR